MTTQQLEKFNDLSASIQFIVHTAVSNSSQILQDLMDDHEEFYKVVTGEGYVAEVHIRDRSYLKNLNSFQVNYGIQNVRLAYSKNIEGIVDACINVAELAIEDMKKCAIQRHNKS